MIREFKALIKPYSEKLENLLKFGKINKVNGSSGKLQKIQLTTLRNIEDALKIGQFGFNSKAPIGSRVVVSEISNEKIVIANEHIASIVDVDSGDSVIYNQTGTYLKLIGDTLYTNADIVIDGISFKGHVHPQGSDSAGDTQQNTGVPQ